LAGGLGAVASGIVLFLAHLVNLFDSKSEFGTVPGESLVLAAHVILVSAIVYVAKVTSHL